MGKTTTTKKITTTAKRAAAKVAPAAVSTEIPAPATVTKPKRAKAAKPLVTKKAAAPKAPRQRKTAVLATPFTDQDIALRAYFIAEKRQQMGHHGTPETDWLEAERQLRVEIGG